MPCRNEAKALTGVLRQALKQVDEIIVVDNRSTDKTANVAKKLGAKVLYEQQNKDGIGYGFALRKGIREAEGDIIVCMDGDGSYPVSKIQDLVKLLDTKKLDFISCNRLPFQNALDMSAIRTVGVKMLNLFVFMLYGFKIKDSLSGMWIFRRQAINNLSLAEGGWNFSLEIKLNAITNPKVKFAEQSIPYHDRVLDSSKQNLLKTGIEHLLFLFSKRFISQKYKRARILTEDREYGLM